MNPGRELGLAHSKENLTHDREKGRYQKEEDMNNEGNRFLRILPEDNETIGASTRPLSAPF
jgi:hypothetical protein